MNRWKVYGIIITALLIVAGLYLYVWPGIEAECRKIGTDHTFKTLVAQIRNRGRPITITIESENVTIICGFPPNQGG